MVSTSATLPNGSEPRILQIKGPDNCLFLIDRYPDGYVWRLHNDGLSAVRRLRPSIAAVQSFHAGKRAFRERESCPAQIPAILELKAGQFSKPEIFVTFDCDQLQLGQLQGKGNLLWPSGSDRSVQVWLVHVGVAGLSGEWSFSVGIRWTFGTRALDLWEKDSGGSQEEINPDPSRWLILRNQAQHAPGRPSGTPGGITAATVGLQTFGEADMALLAASADHDCEIGAQISPEMAQLVEAMRSATSDAVAVIDPDLSSLSQAFEDATLPPFPQEIRAGIEAITAEHNAMFEAVNTETSNYPVRPAHDDKFARFEFFSLHANGLGLSQAGLNEALGKPGEWMRLFQIWKKTRRAPKPKKPSGAPKKPVADKTRALWAEMGKPTRLNKEVCDKLAQHSYPEEYAKTKLHSPARRTLRDRVARQVRVGIKHSAPTT